MSALDTWLKDEHDLERSDLQLRSEIIVSAASLYSKNPLSSQGFITVEDKVTHKIETIVRSIDEDKKGEYREGENIAISDEIARVRIQLLRIGAVIPLSDFPFKEIPSEVTSFFIEGLLREIATAIRTIKGLSFFVAAQISLEPQLIEALNQEFVSTK